jgi:hypothetical protein
MLEQVLNTESTQYTLIYKFYFAHNTYAIFPQGAPMEESTLLKNV